jgi:heme-degrading monooxygenase HmoA
VKASSKSFKPIMIAKTPKPPYYAVIFSSIGTGMDEGYHEMSDHMVELAKSQAGFLGVESARNDIGITVSYWSSLEAIQKWRENAEHQIVRTKGKLYWYKKFKVRISKVEKDYGFEK